MNSSFNVSSFLESISTKQNAHPVASLSKQDKFITKFKGTVMQIEKSQMKFRIRMPIIYDVAVIDP